MLSHLALLRRGGFDELGATSMSRPEIAVGDELFASARWYVASTHPGAETRVEQHVIRQGLRCFVPQQLRTVRHARRLHEKRSAFFPGYIFVSLDLMRDRWRAVNGTLGVRSLIMRGDRPSPCPVGLVEHFLTLTDANGVLNFEPELTPGQDVRVVRGPFSSLSGRLVKLSENGRAQVLLAIMNGNIAVTMAARDIAPRPAGSMINGSAGLPTRSPASAVALAQR